MSKEPGPKELAQRALQRARITKVNGPGNIKQIISVGPNEGLVKPLPPKKLIPFAGKDKNVRGGKNSPNQSKGKP